MKFLNRLYRTGLISGFLAMGMCWLCDAESIKSSVIGNGGGTSSSSGYRIRGTIGQATTSSSDGGTYTLQSGFWNGILYVVFPEARESFENWMNNLDPADLPPEELRGPLDEPAGDGVPNILKYTLGLLPLDPSREGYPVPVTVQDPENPDQNILAIEFIRSTKANVSFLLQGSSSLSGWLDIPYAEEVVESLENGRERVRFMSDVVLGPGEKFFIRLEVLLP